MTYHNEDPTWSIPETESLVALLTGIALIVLFEFSGGRSLPPLEKAFFAIGALVVLGLIVDSARRA